MRRGTRSRSGSVTGLRTRIALLGGALLLGGCLNTSVVVIGETPGLPPPPPPEVAVVVIDESGAAIEGAFVDFGGSTVRTDGAGRAVGEWKDRPLEISVEAPGFVTGTSSLLEYTADPLAVRLQPVVLTGRVVAGDGTGLPGASVRLGSVEATTGNDGGFRLERVEPGDILVDRPAWMSAVASWDGAAPEVEIALEPRIAKALHVAGWIPQDGETWQALLAVADTTEINALVLDLKDESGRVYYQSGVPLALEVGAVRDFYVLEELVAALRARDLYVIGRVVTFQDPMAARARVDLAITNPDGTAFNKNDQYFLDPTDPQAQDYALDLAAEACEVGVHEIQFDYVRFPDGFGSSVRFDGGTAYLGRFDDPVSGAARVGVISGFLDRARDLLNPMGCAVAADVFAIVLSVPDDQGIGQTPEGIGGSVDVLSPMIYPDHYSEGVFGYANPFDHPGGVVDAALSRGMPRLASTTIMRPWLADYYYGPEEVRAEIDAAEQYTGGWMLWNANSNHTPGALRPEDPLR